jgi:hypothetical protein
MFHKGAELSWTQPPEIMDLTAFLGEDGPSLYKWSAVFSDSDRDESRKAGGVKEKDASDE